MYDFDFVRRDPSSAMGLDFELKPGKTGSPGESVSRQFDHSVPESDLLNRIAYARGRLERARSRVVSMQLEAREVGRTQLEYCELLSHLHVLERSQFSRQLELDALLKERREASVALDRQSGNRRR